MCSKPAGHTALGDKSRPSPFFPKAKIQGSWLQGRAEPGLKGSREGPVPVTPLTGALRGTEPLQGSEIPARGGHCGHKCPAGAQALALSAAGMWRKQDPMLGTGVLCASPMGGGPCKLASTSEPSPAAGEAASLQPVARTKMLCLSWKLLVAHRQGAP